MQSQPLQSTRLILRDITTEDAPKVFNIWSNSENDKYMGDPVGSVDEIIQICNEMPTDNIYLKVAVLQETEEIVGTCCFGPTDSPNEWGLGYSLQHSFWGQGYATENVRTLIQYGQALGITDFITDCAEENVASSRVMEKCGMSLHAKSSFVQPATGIEYPSLIYKLSMISTSAQ